MLSIFIAICGIFLTIFFVVGVHEFGHFIIARLMGIKVLRFSFGFGKPLWRWQDKKGTEYVIAALPLGGYIKMLDENEGNVAENDLPFAYNRQPIYKKMAVILAGPVFNMIFAFILYWLLFIIGFTTLVPIIGKITPHSIAANARLQPQQEIVSINHHPVLSWTSVSMRLFFNVGKKGTLTIETKERVSSQEETHLLNLSHWQMDELQPDPLASLGIIPYYNSTEPEKNPIRKIQYSPLIALSHAWQNTYDFTYINLFILEKMLTGSLSTKSLSGPITIFSSAGHALNSGLLPFISFLAFLSISIGIINILPIPGLDGGHLLFQLIECVTRRPVSLRVQFFCYRIGMIFLVILIIQAFVNDLLRFF